MKFKIIITSIVISLITITYFSLFNEKSASLKTKHAHFLKESPFKESKLLSKEERKALGIPPNKYFEDRWELTMNPKTGRPTTENLTYIQKDINDGKFAYAKDKSVPGDAINHWVERGPNNVGGRTKAVMFDPNDASHETVFAGGVSGGLWKNTNISNPNSEWVMVDIPENLSVSSITYDPNNTSTFYLGTGESYTAGDTYGNGAWKSTDAGNTWTQMFGGIEGEVQFVTNATLTVNSPDDIAGDYNAIRHAFDNLDFTTFSGDLVLVDDGSTDGGTGTINDGCSALVNGGDVNGKVAVIYRGKCNFTNKVKNAQNAGAVGVIMINNVSGPPIGMAGDDPTITISSIMISKLDGALIIDAMSSGTVNVTASEVTDSVLSGVYVVPGKTHVNDIVAKDNAGNTELFLALGDMYYTSAGFPATLIGSESIGVYKSIDGGATWTQMTLPLDSDGGLTHPIDLEVGADGTIWMSTQRNIYTGKGGGRIFASTDGTSFVEKHAENKGQRVEIAVSKTDANKIYAVMTISDPITKIKVLKTTDGFNNVSYKALPNDNYAGIPNNDFTNGQGFYDLAIEVNPTNDETVYVGGINWFKSTNGCTSWNQFSNSYGGASPNIHPDQHGITFADANTLLIGNDGGVAYSNNGGSTISHRNKNYNVTQFYHMGVAPTTAFTGDYFVGGAQDNGSWLFENATAGINPGVYTQGGDGAYCFFDQDGTDQYYICNYVYNANIKLYNMAAGTNMTINSESSQHGDFINLEELDSNQNVLFSNYSTFGDNPSYAIRVYKIQSIVGTGFVTKSSITNSILNENPTAFKVSPFTTDSSKLFVGLRNGKIIRIDNANNSPSWVTIDDSNIVGSISDIEFGQNEDEIFVTVYNYGVTSIWYTTNGGSTWQEKEGNLPDIPVNCILQNPLNLEQVLIGTDIGTWWTQDFSNASPTWYHGTSGMNSALVTDMQLRDDNMVFASTYGRGIFSGEFTASAGSTSINDLDQSANVSLYPNPSFGEVSFKLPEGLNSARVNIFDLSGKLVFNKNIDSNDSNFMLDVSILESGNYVVHIKTKNASYSSKLIVQ